MEKSGNNFHCVKCRLAYMTFDQMYEHIKKVHVDDLLSGLSRLDTANIPGPSAEIDIVQPKEPEMKEEGAPMEETEEIEKSPQTIEKEKLEKLIEQRKHHAEILRKHFYGEKSRKDISEKQKSEGKSCLEQLLLDKGKSKSAAEEQSEKRALPMDKDGQKTFAELLGKPSTTIEKMDELSPKTVEFKTPDVTDTESVDEEKLVVLQISQMENLLTNDLLRIYELEADEMAARPKTPKAVTSESQIEFPEDELKIIHEDLKITSKTEGEGSAEIPQVRVREGVSEKEVDEEKMEVGQGYSIHVSGVHPKYDKRILNEIDSFKIRRQKIVTLSSEKASKISDGQRPTSSQATEKSIYVPKINKVVEYDSEEDCYYYVQKEKSEISPEQERKNEEARAILDDKFGDVRTIRVDPYFEYLWRQSLEMKDSSWDISKMTDASRSHAWSNPRLD